MCSVAPRLSMVLAFQTMKIAENTKFIDIGKKILICNEKWWKNENGLLQKET